MLKELKELIDDYRRRDIGKNVYEEFSGGKVPEYGTITKLEDIAIAFYQKERCGPINCNECYWENNCNNSNVLEELIRVCSTMEPSMKTTKQCSCAECVYASSTNPRICMNPDSIAKHSYVNDDSYCDKGEPICEIW